MSRGERWFDWWFRDRADGSVAIAQAPNAALVVFVAATVLRWSGLAGDAAEALGWVGTGALVVWGLDELVRGACPFRRVLGAGVLAFQLGQLGGLVA